MTFPALKGLNTIRWASGGLLFAQRRRRWANIKPPPGPCVMFACHTSYLGGTNDIHSELSD